LLFDGYDYMYYIDAPTILDNLIADRRIPPLVAVLLDTPNEVRGHELLRCSPRFAEALARDVVPWVRGRYRVDQAPSRAVVGGFSAGGVGAAFSGFQRPDLFGNVLSQSGAFWWKPDDDAEYEWLARQFAATPRLPLRFYVDVGRHETWTPPGRPNQLLSNRHLRTVLRAKGYPVEYAEFAGGHSFFCWQLTLADGLQALFGRGQVPTL
jgi:enterochelin esterase family protein